MTKTLLTIFVLTAVVTLGQSLTQELILHESVHENGTYFVFRRESSGPHDLDFSNIQRICARGFWVTYADANYEGQHRFFGTYLENEPHECKNYTFPDQSFRFGGSLDLTEEAISLFTGEVYRGDKIILTGPAMANLNVNSVIYTGRSKWTLYEGQNFNGKSKCADTRDDWIVDGGQNVTSHYNLAQVGSVLKGCSAVELENSKRLYWTEKNRTE